MAEATSQSGRMDSSTATAILVIAALLMLFGLRSLTIKLG